MPPVTLREFFRKRVIDIDPVQRERGAAIEESRQPGGATIRLMFNRHGDVLFTTPRIVTPENAEKFLDYGLWPRSSWPRSLWPISIAEPPKAPAKPTVLERVMLAALSAWPQLVRELLNGTLVATGEDLDADRREIRPEKWLYDLWFDARDNTVCTVWQIDSFDSPKVIPRWADIQVRGALRETTREEIDSAIEMAAAVLKAEPRISRDALYDRLFGGGTWTHNRFRQKIWRQARQKAGLPPHAPKGRRPEK